MPVAEIDLACLSPDHGCFASVIEFLIAGLSCSLHADCFEPMIGQVCFACLSSREVY